MLPGLSSPMRLVGSPRGGIWNCLWPLRARPPLTEPAVGSELEPYAQLEQGRGREREGDRERGGGIGRERERGGYYLKEKGEQRIERWTHRAAEVKGKSCPLR